MVAAFISVTTTICSAGHYCDVFAIAAFEDLLNREVVAFSAMSLWLA
jgi:hypothetical protein